MIYRAAHPSDPGHKEAWEEFMHAYWKPLLLFLLQSRLSEHDAEDLLQSFLLDAIQGRLLTAYTPAQGKFRHWLLKCLKHKLGHFRRDERARTGAVAAPMPIDVEEGSPQDIIVDPRTNELDATFDREWRRQLFERSVEALAAEIKDPLDLRILKEYVLVQPEDRPSGKEMAKLFDPSGRLTAGAMKTRANRLRDKLCKAIEVQAAWEYGEGPDLKGAVDEVLGSLIGSRRKGDAHADRPK